MDADGERYQRVDIWNTSELMADMWAAHTDHFAQIGTLRELRIKNPNDTKQIALMVSAFIEPEVQKSEEDNPSDTIFHLLPPFVVDEELLLTSFVAVMTPWTSPALYGLRGYPNGNIDNGRVWYITYEQPWESLHFSNSDKQMREELQVDRFCSDSALLSGVVPYDWYERGADPPDFWCSHGEDRISLECTQFAIAERREAQAFLAKLRTRVVETVRSDRNAFSHLAGLCLFLRFGDSGGREAYPPAPSNNVAIQEVVDGIKSYSVLPEAWIADPKSPETMPDIPTTHFSFGGSLHACPFQHSVPETKFFTQTGFELGLGYLTKHSFDSAWAQLRAIVHTKDKPGTQDLLISVGAPNADGLVYPSDDLVADTACRSAQEIDEIEHLERVFLHFWSSKRIVQVWPIRKELPRPYSFTYVPTHSHLGPLDRYGPFIEEVGDAEGSRSA